MILLIDNYDSFTYNIFQCMAGLGQRVRVVRNDCITLEQIEKDNYEAIVISPGPGRPDDAGVSMAVIEAFAGKVPIWGICLGHQAIGQVFGGKIIRAPEPVHGKTSQIRHNGEGIYRGLPQPFTAGRYHSLIIDPASMPDCLEVTAATDDGLVMGIRHKQLRVEGVQFHPESILTPDGINIFCNFFK